MTYHANGNIETKSDISSSTAFTYGTNAGPYAQTYILADRGFTGHEFLKYFNLYNMKGRMYDPLGGRFLNVDNYIQMPDFSQSYNRLAEICNFRASLSFFFKAASEVFNQLFIVTFVKFKQRDAKYVYHSRMQRSWKNYSLLYGIT
jgi:hypothetical protein